MKFLDPILLSTFTTILLAELGDKTQIATVTLSGKSNKPLAVFLGSSLALVTACLIGTLAGGSISNLIPTNVIKGLAAAGFLFIGVNMLIGSFKSHEA